MDLHLKGKVALVTGASRGLGFETARVLVEEGACVAINSRTPENILRAAQQLREIPGANVLGLNGDVTSPQVPAQLIDRTVKQFGGVDILIANAGGPPAGRFETFSDEDWAKAIDLSFMSQVRLIRAALPALRKSASPSVLTITSYSVKQPIPDLVLSNSVRMATVGLTKTLALELGTDQIRFNSILPAWTDTERVQNLMKSRAKTKGTTFEEELAAQVKDSPLGRMGTPREFANAAVFLVSPAAAYITGVMLTVDGGMYKGTM
jgi:3-oxoacyl-[acyl-carrier protein] reductase